MINTVLVRLGELKYLIGVNAVPCVVPVIELIVPAIVTALLFVFGRRLMHDYSYFLSPESTISLRMVALLTFLPVASDLSFAISSIFSTWSTNKSVGYRLLSLSGFLFLFAIVYFVCNGGRIRTCMSATPVYDRNRTVLEMPLCVYQFRHSIVFFNKRGWPRANHPQISLIKNLIIFSQLD